MNEQHKIGCMSCKHNNFDGGCAAFPEVIPFSFTAEKPHLQPVPSQNNEIVYEWIDRIEQRARMKKNRSLISQLSDCDRSIQRARADSLLSSSYRHI
jgi:hypothetical protein